MKPSAEIKAIYQKTAERSPVTREMFLRGGPPANMTPDQAIGAVVELVAANSQAVVRLAEIVDGLVEGK